jgi:hypothetical protein
VNALLSIVSFEKVLFLQSLSEATRPCHPASGHAGRGCAGIAAVFCAL